MIYFKGHTYELIETLSTFAQAKAAAVKAGGHLAIVETAAENGKIFDLASASDDLDRSTAGDAGDHQYVWLGGTDFKAEGTWKWLDGREIADGFEAWGGKLGVQEPDNFPNSDPTGQDGLSLGIDGWRYGDPGQWNDVALSNRLFYVIEYDALIGTSGSDALRGSSADDVIEGRGGKDRLTGGKGDDTFVFAETSDSPTTKRADRITDFAQGRDTIDLSGIDANANTARENAFRFLGEDAAPRKAGDLWFATKAGQTSIFGDVDGDGKADLVIRLDDVVDLKAADFIL